MDNIAEKEFKEKANKFELLYEYAEKFDASFLNIKLGFLAFVGIIFTLAFSARENFTNCFFLALSTILLAIFILFISELYIQSRDLDIATKKQLRRTVLAKIRHIATIENSLESYGIEAERLLIEEDRIRSAMRAGNKIEDIVRDDDNGRIRFWVLFVSWTILFLSLPTLFLLELLRVFK
ncbi:MAG: hypothetical protein UW71_C0025G0005 [Parcubacteria group bacterium GW2011_GWB1_44_7]|nr:MAG: hypothetical protein UW71_C0025G0005 [Parcubacteria group bacterium GW2011_GWB1_44_7]